MARDRLAAMRAQQGGDPYASNGSAPTPRQTRQNPFDQREPAYDQRNNYELSQVGNRTNYNSAPVDDMTAFYNEIASVQDEIRNYNGNVDQISRLHTQLLQDVEPSNSRGNQDLENLIEETRAMSASIKRRIEALRRQPVDARSQNLRKPQIELVQAKFIEAIQKFQGEEKLYRDKYKERMARQFKIVNPNATQDEINQVVNNDASGQIFAQALMGNRYADSQGAYREVQQRHEDILRINKTLAELAQLFNDMSILVEQQDEQVKNIESTALTVEKDTEAGLGYTDKAVGSARAARKKRWICFFITLIILAIIGIVVGVVVSNNIHNNNNNNNNKAQ